MKAVPAVVKLGEPIQAHGSTMHELTIRPPVGKDLRVAGYPFRIAGGGEKSEMVTDAAVVSRLISDLAGIPLSSVDQMQAADWQACMSAVSIFLAPTGSRNLLTDTTNKQDGGGIPDTSGT